LAKMHSRSVHDRTAELNSSRQLLQTIAETQTVGLSAFRAIRDAEDNIIDLECIFANAAAEKNAEHKKLDKMKFLTFFPGVEGERIFQKYCRVIETGISHDEEWNYMAGNEDLWKRNIAVKLGDGVLVTEEDITGSKRAELIILRLKDEIAQQATDKYHAILNSIDDAFVFCEIIRDDKGKPYDFRYLEFNSSFEKQRGIKTQALRGRRALESHTSIDPWWIETCAQVVSTGIPARFERFFDNGWYEVNVYHFKGDRFSILLRNITERKESEEALKNTSRRLQMSLVAGKLGTYENDFDLGNMECSAQHKINFGFNKNDNPSLEEIKERIIPEDRKEMEAQLDEAVHNNGNYSSEYRVRLPSGVIRWIRSVGHIMYTKNHEKQKITGITIDITKQKEFTEELGRQVTERTFDLKRSNEDLRQFAHVASHDLKEPMRKIKTYNDRIIREFSNELPDTIKTYLAKIDRSANRMLSMIEGVLRYSKAENSEYKFKKVNLNDIINEIRSDLELMIHEKRAEIITSELPVIPGIDVLIYQLFYNLILNSLKFSKPGVVAEIRIKSETVILHEREFHKVTLTDNGIGFDLQYQDEIFKSFKRLNAVDEYEGSGLGLALCKKIVARHNGFISATGLPDNYAIFDILLPRTELEI
jgi:signal transduction histidine kinase